jgi:hypothetical protein
MPQVRFEHTIPVFERGKTVHALDRAATVIGIELSMQFRNLRSLLVNDFILKVNGRAVTMLVAVLLLR